MLACPSAVIWCGFWACQPSARGLASTGCPPLCGLAMVGSGATRYGVGWTSGTVWSVLVGCAPPGGLGTGQPFADTRCDAGRPASHRHAAWRQSGIRCGAVCHWSAVTVTWSGAGGVRSRGPGPATPLAVSCAGAGWAGGHPHGSGLVGHLLPRRLVVAGRRPHSAWCRRRCLPSGALVPAVSWLAARLRGPAPAGHPLPCGSVVADWSASRGLMPKEWSAVGRWGRGPSPGRAGRRSVVR